MQNVDIIIPIYNGLEDLKKCLESIRKHTDLKKNRVILINDKSPDEGVHDFLVTQQGENVILIDSLVNEGFSASVNKGICYSDRDVILLNSDTIVTSGWVEKIVCCAYSENMIGTVTPLSNSATLCSVPIICQDNSIPEGRTVDEYSEIIEKCSLRKYPEITVAVGFCMHIKRTVIDQVGLFDGKTFERGYGEENDFCNRAGLLGYKHVLCDDTFIYHKGTVSFVNEEKKKLIESHTKILNEWYPYQMKKNHLYCMTNPDQYIRDNIEIWNGVLNGKKNVLLMVQSDFRKDASDHTGGTQFHVKDLVGSLKNVYNVFVVARDLEFLRLTVYDSEKMLSFKFYIGKADEYPQIHDRKLKQILQQIIEGFSISLIHVHHVYRLSFDIFDIAKELNVPYVMTVHDYYYICPIIKLNNCNGEICDSHCEDKMCGECLNKKCQIVPRVGFIQKWRQITEEALYGAEEVVFPSSSAKKIFEVYYPDHNNKYSVIGHGLDKFESGQIEQTIENVENVSNIESCFDKIMDGDFKISGWAFMHGISCADMKIYLYIKDSVGKCFYVPCQKIARYDVSHQFGMEQYTMSGFLADTLGFGLASGKIEIQILIELEGKFYLDTKVKEYRINKKILKDAKLNVAFLGGLVQEKGSHLAYQLIQRFKQDINWYVIGGINDYDLENIQQDNLLKFGAYDREDTYRILDEYKIDIVCILSTWPETFCYTLSEAWLAGIPAIATSIGALSERLMENKGGWMFEVSEHMIDDIELLLKQLCNDVNQVERMKSIVKNIPLKSVKMMGKEYEGIYNRLAAEYRLNECKNKEVFLEGFCMEKNRFYRDSSIAVKRTMEGKIVAVEQNYAMQLQICQKQYDKVMQDYGRAMQRLDRIRRSVWYKLYKKISR